MFNKQEHWNCLKLKSLKIGCISVHLICLAYIVHSGILVLKGCAVGGLILINKTASRYLFKTKLHRKMTV